MAKRDIEQIKRYIAHADRRQSDANRDSSSGWLLLHGLLWLLTLILFLIWMDASYDTVGPWWTLAVLIAFAAMHVGILLAILKGSRKRHPSRFQDDKRLRFDYRRPSIGQICTPRLPQNEGVRIPQRNPISGGRSFGLRPIFLVTAIDKKKTLTLQLIRCSNPEDLGRIYRDVPHKDVKPIES